MGAPSRARLALVSACESGAALRYARYGSELAHVAVGSCDDVTGCQVHRSFSCTVRRNANFAHSAFQEVPRACLQLLGHSRCLWRVAVRAGGGQKVEPAAQLLVHSQAKCELRAQRVSGGAARVSAALRQRPLLLVRRGAAWPGSESQRER